MKNKLLILAMGLALTTQMVMAQVPSYVPSNGLVGYWPFNGNANDESGNGNNGSYTGSSCNVCGSSSVTAPPILTSDRFNNSDSAFQFSDQLDLISIANSSSLQLTSPYTISLWLNPSTYNLGTFGWGVIVAKWGEVSSASYQLRISDTGKLIYDTHDGSNTTSLTSNSSIQLNSWTFVVIRQINSSVSISINGITDISNPNMLIPAIVNNTIEIGRNYNQFSNYSTEGFIGKIDDVSIYNRALTQDEIANLYYAENTCQSLVINTGVLSFNPPVYNNTVTIYPNPANDQITIDCGNLANVSGWTIKIVNTLGQEVFSGAMNTQQYVVPLNSWSGQGIYFVKIYDGSNNLMNTKKIILQ